MEFLWEQGKIEKGWLVNLYMISAMWSLQMLFFSTCSARQVIRTRFAKVNWGRRVSHKHVPIQVSMWRSIYDCLTIDECIRQIGIPIVSKCNSCVEAKVADKNHVLIWKYDCQEDMEYFFFFF